MIRRGFVNGAKSWLAVGILFMALLTAALPSQAQGKGKKAGLAAQVQGNWTLVSIYNEQDGKKSDVFGSNPRGSLMLAPDGRFSLILMRATLPKFAANNRIKGTAEENQAVVQGSNAFFGTYKVQSESENKVMLHIEGCTFPNWDGLDQVRIMTVTGDEMKMTTLQAAVGGTNHIVWKRIAKPAGPAT